VARDDTIVAESIEPTTRSHGVSLPRLVQATLERAGVGWDAVQGLAVSIGPGSFTGLRVGLSLAKGIAYAGGLPIAPVPTLEALAWAAEPAPGDTVWAVLDARMREVYAAAFERTVSGLERRTPDEALAPGLAASRIGPGSILVGDAVEVYPELARTGVRVLPFATHPPRGGIVARLGAALLRAGAGAEIGPLEPVYVRASQAERARER
jgi:tRNA threonylcarbamoyladenosine biosynthesis protein TsaB